MNSDLESKRRRFVIVGSTLIALAIAFFFYMFTIAGKSNDPVTLMHTVGTVSGVVSGIGLTMIVIGLLRFCPPKSSSKPTE